MHFELVSALLVVEKHNQLLMKNHNARPVGSQVVLEAHAIILRNDSKCDAPNPGGPLTIHQPAENLYVSYHKTHTLVKMATWAPASILIKHAPNCIPIVQELFYYS